MKEQILKNLILGNWSFDYLMPLFHEAVNLRCQTQGITSNAHLFVKSLAAFTKIDKFDYQISNKQFVQIPITLQNFLKKNSIPGDPVPCSSNVNTTFIETINLLQKTSPQSYIAWENHIDGIVKISGGNFYGASHPHIIAVILLGDKFFNSPTRDRALSLVHEMGHQELFLINTLDRLVQQGFEYSMLHAPFQGKERPPIARLHSLFALFRMVQFERENGILRSNNYDLLCDNIQSFRDGELTPFGLKTVESICAWASN